MINNPKIRKLWFNFRYKLLTPVNLMLLVGAFLVTGWIYQGVISINRNYKLQKKVDYKIKQLKLLELETANLEYEKEYYKTAEYQDLVLRQSLNKIGQNEKVFVIKLDQDWIEKQNQRFAASKQVTTKQSNFQKWFDFLAGNNHR